MASCRECSNPFSDGDRFCARCGSLLADDIEVLSTDKAVTTTHLARQGSSPVALVVAAGALLMVGMFWVLSRSSDDASVADADDDRAASVAVDEDAPDEDVAEEGTAEEDDQADEQPNETVDDEMDDDVTEETSRTDTTGGDRGAAEEHAFATEEPGPILGEEVGFSLWIGGNDDLTRVDLDTAEIQRFDVADRRPILISGDWLVLTSTNGGDGLFSVPLDNPNADQVRLGSDFYWDNFIHASSNDPDRIWVLGESGSLPVWESIRLSDGEIVEESPASISTFSGLVSGPDLASAPDGGIYERRSDGYVRVSDGALAGLSDHRALVRTCTGPTSCTVHWRDRSTWERVDGPDIPDGVLEGTFPAWLSAGGRVLFAFSSEGERVFDLERGTTVDVTGEDVWALRPGSVSSDERLIATVNAQTPAVYDLDTGEVYLLDELRFRGEVGTLFTDNG